MSLFPRVCRIVLLVIPGVAIGFARADEPIRWKLQSGAQLGYSIVQEMTISGGEGDADKLQNKSRQQLDITWQVKGVNAAGEPVIGHRFNRIRSQMTLPTGHLEYDSAAAGPPSGMAAINAPLYAALIKSPVEITLWADGRTKSVQVPEAVKAALKKVPTSTAIGDLADAERFQALFLPGFPYLPNGQIEPGLQWSIKSNTDLTSAGKQTIETAYVYEGRREVEGVSYAVIGVTRTIGFEAGEASQRSVKEQSSEGEILFDTAAGRLQSSRLKHQATITITVANRATEQKIDQSIEVKFVPPRN